MPETEEGADGDGFGARGDEPPCHEIDGRNVVRVEGVAEAEGVGEEGRSDEGGVRVQDDANDGPD